MDEDAEVLFISQPSWPFEYSIDNVTSRKEVELADQDERRDYDDDRDYDEREYRDGEKSNDVFLVEGRQLRYGSKAAWDVM
jgi:hypothetical protein